VSTERPEPPPRELARLFDSVVGAVTLRVSDIGLQRDFYERVIGLEAAEGSPETAELSNADGLALIRLDASTARGSEPLRTPHTGLFHTAFRYPDRASLGAAVVRTMEVSPVFQGASDHGVSEAVYFADPEGNGVELYRDRPFDEWPSAEPGRVGMFTQPLDLGALAADAQKPGGIARCDVGHVHLMAADIEAALAFWRDVVGLDERQRFGAQAIFVAEGLYHHHVGANTWQSLGASPAPADRPGLDGFELRLRSADAVGAAATRLERAGHAVAHDSGRVETSDPDGNALVLISR